MNSNFNRQFILIDFALLDDPKFIAFFNTAEFATYMILRRHVWRGGENTPHFLGLHDLYEHERLLVSSISRERLAATLQLRDVTRVSKHLTKLEQAGVVQRMRTGRQSIYVLGEWVDYSEGTDGSKRLEWFYLDRAFGLCKTDVAKRATSDVGKRARRTWPKKPRQMWRKTPHSNREENREDNSVTNGVGDNVFSKLPALQQPKNKTEFVAQQILDALQDEHSAPFYRLVAAKVPEDEVLRALAEIRADGAEHPERLFTFKMKRYALSRMKQSG